MFSYRCYRFFLFFLCCFFLYCLPFIGELKIIIALTPAAKDSPLVEFPTSNYCDEEDKTSLYFLGRFSATIMGRYRILPSYLIQLPRQTTLVFSLEVYQGL